ncbi:MAG: HIT domain-containing protein [Nanoarchaeota archaeon]
MATEDELKNMSPEQIAEMQKQQCIFCRIIKGEIPSKKVYEDESMVAILDINPASPGHVLVMPKEHYPILPLLPPQIFKHIFTTTKYLCKGIKTAMVTDSCTVFIANGAVAGQQSPHFLFHIIPREPGDGLANFELAKKEFSKEEIDQAFISLGNNVRSIVREYLVREGRIPKQPMQAPAPQLRTEELSQIIDQNPQLKALIMEHPEQLKAILQTNPQLARLFAGVDIDKLSLKLNEIEREKQKGNNRQNESQEKKKKQDTPPEAKSKETDSSTQEEKEEQNSPVASEEEQQEPPEEEQPSPYGANLDKISDLFK